VAPQKQPSGTANRATVADRADGAIAHFGLGGDAFDRFVQATARELREDNSGAMLQLAVLFALGGASLASAVNVLPGSSPLISWGGRTVDDITGGEGKSFDWLGVQARFSTIAGRADFRNALS